MRKEKLRPPSRVKKGAVWGEEKPRRACGCASTPHGVLLRKSRKRGRIIVAEELYAKRANIRGRGKNARNAGLYYCMCAPREWAERWCGKGATGRAEKRKKEKKEKKKEKKRRKKRKKKKKKKKEKKKREKQVVCFSELPLALALARAVAVHFRCGILLAHCGRAPLRLSDPGAGEQGTTHCGRAPLCLSDSGAGEQGTKVAAAAAACCMAKWELVRESAPFFKLPKKKP